MAMNVDIRDRIVSIKTETPRLPRFPCITAPLENTVMGQCEYTVIHCTFAQPEVVETSSKKNKSTPMVGYTAHHY